MIHRIGIIAENNSDVQVIEELIPKIVPSQQFKVRPWIGHGCGKIVGKCRAWALDLKTKQCKSLMVVHDLDDRNESELELQIRMALKPCPIAQNTIIIPVKEIEAWLLSDNEAIRRALNLKDEVPLIPNPESIADPKKRLEEIVYLRSHKTKRYNNTSHNQKIASELRIDRVRQCKSFQPLEEFILKHLK